MIRPPDRGPHQAGPLATWLEICAIAAESGVVRKGQAIELLFDASLAPDAAGPRRAIAYRDERMDATDAVADAWQLLRTRANRCGGGCPFTVDSDALRRRPDTASLPEVAAYASMVVLEAAASRWFSSLSLAADGDDHHARTWFESIASAALAGLTDATPIQFATRDRRKRRDFPKRVERLATCLSLRPRIDEVGKFASDQQDDDTLDVVVRLPFGDRADRHLGGAPFLLAQCATGVRWLKEKENEPNLKVWETYISWNGPLLKAIAIPYALDTAKEVVNASKRHNDAIVLDRLRLACGRPDLRIDQELRTLLARWCGKKIARLPRAAA